MNLLTLESEASSESNPKLQALLQAALIILKAEDIVGKHKGTLDGTPEEVGDLAATVIDLDSVIGKLKVAAS